MKLKEVPIGTKLLFGSYAMNDGQEPQDLTWTKVTEDGKAVLAPNQISCMFDAREVGDANRDRRAHGYNYFPYANVFRFINSPEQRWFLPAHDCDAGGYLRNRYGFLSSFSEDELSALLPQEIEVGVPEGSRKQFGRKVKLKCLVTLPSASQYEEVRDEYLKCEGERIPALHDHNVFLGWTRSGVKDTCHVAVARYGYLDEFHCDHTTNLCPMISLDQNIELLAEPDECGRYIVKVKTKATEEIMKDDFLTMVFQ